MSVDNSFNFCGILIFVGLIFGTFILKLNDEIKDNQSYEMLQSEQLKIISNIYNLFNVAKNSDTSLQPNVFENINKKSINTTKILILANPRYTKDTINMDCAQQSIKVPKRIFIKINDLGFIELVLMYK